MLQDADIDAYAAEVKELQNTKNHIKGPKKRTEEDDERFAQSFEKMIRMAVESEM